MSILSTVWDIILPILLLGTIIITIKSFINKRHNNSLIFFSRIFIGMIIISYIIFNISMLIKAEKDIINSTLKSQSFFYEWIYYLSFIILIVCLILTMIRKIYKK